MGMARRIAAATLLALSALTMVVVKPAAADTAGDEAAFLSSLNSVRTSKGLKALSTHGALTEVARAWARTMAAANSISHNGSLASQGPSEWERLGENVGMGMEVPAVHDAFVNSPAHYKNMVDPGFDTVGIGVVRNADGVLFVTVNFMQVQATAAAPAPAPVPPTPAPAPAPAPGAIAASPAAAPAPPAPAPAAVPVAVAAAALPAATPIPTAALAAAVEPAAAPVATPDPLVLGARSAAAVSGPRGAGTISLVLALIGVGVLLAGGTGALAMARRPPRTAALAYR